MTSSLVRALAALAATVPLLTTLGCGGSGSAPADAPDPATSAAAPSSVQVDARDAAAAGIETIAARFVERADPLEAVGRVTFDERRTARLGSLVEGIVHRLDAQPGDTVARGAIVAQLHSHVVHDAWAAYFKGLAAQRRAETELAYARTAESRAAQLVADKALSPQELERARADLTTATQALVAVKAEITRTEQELAHYGIDAAPDADPLEHEDVPVVAPFGGVVIERLATEGSTVTPGTPLVVISDLSRVWVTAEIDETLVGRVVTGRPVTVKAPAYPDESFAGTLTAVGDVVNPDDAPRHPAHRDAESRPQAQAADARHRVDRRHRAAPRAGRAVAGAADDGRRDGGVRAHRRRPVRPPRRHDRRDRRRRGRDRPRPERGRHGRHLRRLPAEVGDDRAGAGDE